MQIFNQCSLRDEIVRVWGPAGAHVEVFDELLKRAVRGEGASSDEYTKLADEAVERMNAHADSILDMTMMYRLEHAVRELVRVHLRALESFSTAIGKAEKERDEVRAEVERLTAERDDYFARLNKADLLRDDEFDGEGDE